jgi:hypothetical protein
MPYNNVEQLWSDTIYNSNLIIVGLTFGHSIRFEKKPKKVNNDAKKLCHDIVHFN